MNQIVRCCCCLLTFLAFQGQAQTEARLSVDSFQVETGNLYVLHLTMQGNTLPDTLDISPWQGVLAPKNVLRNSGWRRNGNSSSNDIELIFFDADSITLVPLAITVNHTDTSFTNQLDLVIYPTPSPDDLNDMAPIKDIRREPVLWTDYLPWILGIVGVAALLGLVFWWYGRHQKRNARSRGIQLLPHELAFKKLEVLAQKSLWQKGGYKEQCAELTFILREYLEKRFDVPALESTSEEILSQLATTDFPADLSIDLGNVLTQADLVKFAKAIPPDAFYLYSMDFAQALIARTIPPPPTEETGSLS